MELRNPGTLLATFLLFGGCSGTASDSTEEPVELPKSAVVFDDREQACRELEDRIAAGDVSAVDRPLSPAETRAISDQLFAYEDVIFTAPTECGGSAAFVVGVEAKQAGVPEEVDGVPLLVYYQHPIELL